jgi:hypothetical protein
MGGEVRAIFSLFNVGQLNGFAHFPQPSRSFEPKTHSRLRDVTLNSIQDLPGALI